MNYLRDYVKRIKGREAGAEEDFIKEYLPITCRIITKDPFSDKISDTGPLAQKALQSFIENVKKGKNPEHLDCQRFLLGIIKNHIKEAFNIRLRSLCTKVYQGAEGAEEMLCNYEVNILDFIQKSRYGDSVPDHTGAAKKIIREFKSLIREVGGKDIRDFHAFFSTMIIRRMIDQCRRENRIVTCPEDVLPRRGLDQDCTQRMEEGILGKLSREKLRRTLFDLFKDLEQTDRIIILKRYYEEKPLKKIAEEIAPIAGYHMDESTVSKRLKRVRKGLLKGFRQKGIHDLKDLGG